MEYDQKEMNFLDINLQVKGKKVITNIYYKLTGTHNHVPFQSKHLKHSDQYTLQFSTKTLYNCRRKNDPRAKTEPT